MHIMTYTHTDRHTRIYIYVDLMLSVLSILVYITLVLHSVTLEIFHKLQNHDIEFDNVQITQGKKQKN